jgi:hypothetical protein
MQTTQKTHKVTVKNKKPWFKNWLRDWAIFDILFPIGAGLLAYFVRTANDGFWLNLSTELIGVYISIRFIDWLIGRRETRHYRRRDLAGNLFWFFEVAEKLSPYYDEWRIKDLEKEIQAFDELWEERKRLLDREEIALVETVRENRKEIVSLAIKYVEDDKKVEKIRDKFYEAENVFPEWLRELEDNYRDYHRTSIWQINLIPFIEKAEGAMRTENEVSTDNLAYIKKYIESIKRVVQNRENYENEVRTHGQLVREVKLNIEQESGRY